MMRSRLAALKKRQRLDGMTPEEFRAVRIQANLSQVEFAERLGYHPMSMTRFENGREAVRPKLAKLVKALFRQARSIESQEAESKKPRTSRVAG